MSTLHVPRVLLSTVVGGVLMVLGGCSSYGHGEPQPKTKEEKLAACGVLLPAVRAQMQSSLRQELVKETNDPAASVALGEPYRARTYRGVLNYGHFRYGWGIPVRLSWNDRKKKPVVRDEILFVRDGRAETLVSAAPGMFIEKVE